MKLPIDFRDLLEEFAREGVEHVLIGGYAFSFHASPRATKDLDLLLGEDAENLARAATALARYGAPATVVEAVRRLGPDEVAFLGHPPLRIDMMRRIDGVDNAAVIRNSVAAAWDGLPIRIIGLDDLIKNKRAAGRPQDIADADRLEKISSRRGS